MELDELKYQLKDRLSGPANKSAEELCQLLAVKTTSITGKLKRSLYIELGLAVLFTLLFTGIFLFASSEMLRIYFGVFSVVCVVFGITIGLLIKKINYLTNASLSINNNLATLINILQEFTRRYFQFTMGLLPVCFFFSFYLGYSSTTPAQYSTADITGSTGRHGFGYYLFFTLYFIGTAIALYYFTRWYLARLYGKYITELKTVLADLNDPV